MTCNGCKYMTTIKKLYVEYEPSGHWLIPPTRLTRQEKATACGLNPGKPKEIPENRVPCSQYEV